MFQFSKAAHHASGYFSRVGSTIGKEYLAFTVGLILDKVAFEQGAISEQQLAEALPDIHSPVSFVVLFAEVTAAIGDFSVTVLFTAEEFANVLGSVVISSSSLPINLSILKHSGKLAAITH